MKMLMHGMASLSDRVFPMLPALLAMTLLALFSAPVDAGSWPWAPNIAWLMTLVVVTRHPSAWPRWWAFVFGAVQDVVFATPLGAQALLTLLLVPLAELQARRQAGQRFPARWCEIAGVLLVWHLLLWAVVCFVTPDAPSIRSPLHAALASVLWYPLFFAGTRIARFND